MMTYTYGLFDSHDQQLDTTNIDEENLDLAMDLFLEFGENQHGVKYSINSLSGHYVLLLEEVEDLDAE